MLFKNKKISETQKNNQRSGNLEKHQNDKK